MAEAKKGLTPREQQLLCFIRQLGWGEVRLLIQNGEPVLICESVKTVRLEDENSD